MYSRMSSLSFVVVLVLMLSSSAHGQLIAECLIGEEVPDGSTADFEITIFDILDGDFEIAVALEVSPGFDDISVWLEHIETGDSIELVKAGDDALLDCSAVVFTDNLDVLDDVIDACSATADLSVFEGNPTDGDWTITVEDTVEDDETVTLEIWCIYFYGPDFIRGDVDGNGVFAPLLDAIFLLKYGFQDGESPSCMMAADVNGDDEVAVLQDALAILNYAFGDADPPQAPTSCGFDTLDLSSSLSCDEADCD